MDEKQPTALIILDGFGYSQEKEYNPIFNAFKPNIEFFIKNYPWCLLHSSGEYVGLPKGYIGNSEVGHLTIGAGKRIEQPVTIINNSIEDGTFFKNEAFIDNLKIIKDKKSCLHIIGLLSNGGVHSNLKILYAFIKASVEQNLQRIYLHLFLDGRDSPPESAKTFLLELDAFINEYKQIKIGSIQGRYFAMDRDKNWQRMLQAYNVLTTPQKIDFKTWRDAIDHYYCSGITDEFIPPTQLDTDSIIKNNDGVIFFNFRPDRARQLVAAFVDKHFDSFDRKQIDLSFFITPVSFDSNLETTVLFKIEPIKNTLMDILAKAGLKTFSIAETEKYAHITYFFKGGREKILPNETQVLIPSIKTSDDPGKYSKSKTYAEFPCMSAPEITQAVLDSLKSDPKDFYLINYANADMVGHSGDFQATKKAIECLDKQLGLLYDEIVIKLNGTMYITADHGNAEVKFDQNTGRPNTAHTTNPVPFIMVQKDLKGKKIKLTLTELADIKNFILKNINLA